jgi:uncharacterized protein (TIGR02145 family)
MKILILVAVIIFSDALIAQSEKVYIPDPNFRNYLQTNYSNCMDGDSLITDCEQIQNEAILTLYFQNISDITGIKYFTNLFYLSVYMNSLDSLGEISELSNLSSLDISYNNLSNLNGIENLTNLSNLNLNGNNISNLAGIQYLTMLSTLDCEYNQLSNIQYINSLSQLTSLRISGNTMLSDITGIGNLTSLWSLDAMMCAINDASEMNLLVSLRTLDLSSNPINTLPDLSSLNYLWTISLDNCSLNFLPKFPQSLQRIWASEGVDSIPDLSYLPNLGVLSIGYNNLNSIPDLSLNNNLTSLRCIGNKLTSLPNLSNLPNLSQFWCSRNKLTFEDIEPNIGINGFGYTPQDTSSYGLSRDTTVSLGSSITLYANVNGNFNLYQWYKNGQLFGNQTTNNSISLNNFSGSDEGIYHCVVTNSIVPGLSLFGSVMNITVNEPLQYTLTANDSTVCAGTTITLSVNIQQQNIMTDIDGNVYPTVQIGNQIWMKENLRTTKYSDGSDIPLVTDNAQWAGNWNNSVTLPMMCWYNNDQATYTANKFGALYNWYAVSPTTNGNKNACPTGWHVPSDAEWAILENNLGGSSVAGGKMKSTGTQYWLSPNQDATNASGISGLPSGYRANNDGTFYAIGRNGRWWSSTEFNTHYAWVRSLGYNNSFVDRGYVSKTVGFSVRCIKD